MDAPRTRLIAATLPALLAALLVGLWAPAADAAPQPRVTVHGGSLAARSEPQVDDFPDVLLDGDGQQVATGIGDFRVCDSRGDGSGWRLVVRATPLAEWDPDSRSYVAGGETLPAGSLTVDGFEARRVGATTCPLPATVPGPFSIDVGSPALLLVAPQGAGMGAYDVGALGALTLTVPADTAAGVYRSDLTFSMVAGP